jgi:hypothetical protein
MILKSEKQFEQISMHRSCSNWLSSLTFYVDQVHYLRSTLRSPITSALREAPFRAHTFLHPFV